MRVLPAIALLPLGPWAKASAEGTTAEDSAAPFRGDAAPGN
jgi:hypothetical protein